jgi:hypothetical protein
VRRKRNVPAPSLLELQRERRETTELRYSGRCRRQHPETHGPCSGPPVAKSLVYGPGPGSSWGDRASSPPRFNTYSRSSTHLGAARLGPGFFLSFGSLKPRRWDLGPGLVGTQDWGDNFKSDLGFRTSTDSTPARSFEFLKPGRWDLGPGLVGIQDWGHSFKSDLGFRTSTDSTPTRLACTRAPSGT